MGLPLLETGLNFFTSFKLLHLAPLLLSGITMYINAWYLTRNKIASLTTAIVYIWAPYRFLINFVSASTGIAWIFPFIPLLITGLIRARKKPHLSVLVIAISVSGLILSHLLSTLTVIYVAVTWCICFFSLKRLKPITSGILLGLLLASFYFLPFLQSSSLSRASAIKGSGFTDIYTHNFVNIKQLLYSKWGFGPIVNNAKDGEISFQVGIVQWLGIVAVALIALLVPKYRRLSIWLVATYGGAMFLMLDPSKPIWDIFTKYMSFDYPTRFLIPAVYISSLAVGLTNKFLPKKLQIICAIFCIVVALYTNRNHTRVNLYTNLPLFTYVDSELTTNTHHEYLPKTADPKLLDHIQPLTDPSIPTLILYQNTNTLLLSVSTPSATLTAVNQLVFPGIKVSVNNHPQPLNNDSRGRVYIQIPSGESTIKVQYQPPRSNVLASLVSLSTYAVLLLLSLKYAKKYT